LGTGTKFAEFPEKEITKTNRAEMAGNNGQYKNALGFSTFLPISLHMAQWNRTDGGSGKAPRQAFVAVLLLLSGYVSAIDGILSLGDKNRKSNSFSNIKRDMRISLGSGLHHYRSTQPLPHLAQPGASPRNMVIYQRGNVSIHIPVKSKPSILQTFRTPTAPTIR